MTKLQSRCLRPLLIISVLALPVSFVAASPPAKTLTGKVVGITDGDTLTLLVDKTQVKVRLEGTGYWLNTSTGVRHNRSCRNYRKTKRGRPCGPDGGKACGMCVG